MSNLSFESVKAAASGRWREILTGLGIEAHYLTNKHGPCPGCGGADRFRFDDKDGNGGFICGQGGDPLAGDGFELLGHVYGWDKSESLHQVAGYLGMDDRQPLSETERAELKRQQAEYRQQQATRQAKEEAERQARQEEAAQRALAVLGAAQGDPATHPYAVKKGLPLGALVKRGAWPQRGWNDALLVPIYGADGNLWTVEAISPDGDKDFLAGGR